MTSPGTPQSRTTEAFIATIVSHLCLNSIIYVSLKSPSNIFLDLLWSFSGSIIFTVD